MDKFSKDVRVDILKMIHNSQSGHTGGAFSCTDILNALYNKVMFVPKEWKKSADFNKRDRFILSKGHACPALYATLANLGFFSREELMTFRILGSRLQGHPAVKTGLEGIETSTGSLGQGMSIGTGMALALRLDKNPASVFVLMGDGEMQEGSVWESLMNASHHKLTNIVPIIDKNGLQIDGNVCDVQTIDPLDKKLEAFGYEVLEVDGHDVEALADVLNKAKKSDKLTAVIAKTVKGKGVSFMENNAGWHGKAPNDEQLALALEELNV